MKLELLDAYNIRARLSASILLLAPIAINLFFLFDAVRSFATSSVILFVLLAFTNYIPTLQRRLGSNKNTPVNYVAEMLSLQDTTFDTVSKTRYYKKLASLDESFSHFLSPDDSEEFHRCQESAVLYLRSQTRGNHLVQEENINYGFCRNLLANKRAGIIMCVGCLISVVFYSIYKYDDLSSIPSQNYLALVSNMLFLLFWIFGINKNVLTLAGKHYAKALIISIDSIEKKR